MDTPNLVQGKNLQAGLVVLQDSFLEVGNDAIPANVELAHLTGHHLGLA